MSAIFKREFKAYFTNMSGWLFMTILLLFTGIFVTAVNLLGGYAALEYALENVIIVFLLIVPVLTMRSVAEDKHARTDALLYSLPLKLSAVVFGKYLAMVAVLALPCLLIALYPLLLGAFGSVSLLGAYASLFGLLLLGSALISVGMFMSSLTESQVIAAVLGFAASLLLYFAPALAAMIPSSAIASLVCFLALALLAALILYCLTKNISVSVTVGLVLAALTVFLYFFGGDLFTGAFPALLGTLALFDRFYHFTYGIFDLKDVLFYLSFSTFFVFLTVRSLEKKRWS